VAEPESERPLTKSEIRAAERKQLLKELMDKQYLGDGAYIHHDGWHVWITTSDGTTDTNRIALEPAVLTAFEGQLQRMKLLMASIERLDEAGAEGGEG